MTTFWVGGGCECLKNEDNSAQRQMESGREDGLGSSTACMSSGSDELKIENFEFGTTGALLCTVSDTRIVMDGV